MNLEYLKEKQHREDDEKNTTIKKTLFKTIKTKLFQILITLDYNVFSFNNILCYWKVGFKYNYQSMHQFIPYKVW